MASCSLSTRGVQVASSALPGRLVRLVVAVLLLQAGNSLRPESAFGQLSGEWDAGRTEVSRDRLVELLSLYEQTALSTAYSPEFRARARMEADVIRVRMEEGDFQTGDLVAVIVEGEDELTGEYTVTANRAISFPVVGDVSLRGVLRSELESHIRRQLAGFIREPVVTAQSSIRILISGEVARPGYYEIGTQSLLSKAIMDAGGPLPTARLSEVRIERANNVLWDGEALQKAIAEGRSIDQLSVQSGDHIVVPTTEGGGLARVGQLVVTGVPLLVLILSSAVQLF